MKSNIKNKKGFTLVELLVVLAIIGLLAVIGIPVILNAQRASRDAARLKQLESVNAAAASIFTKTNAEVLIVAAPAPGTTVNVSSSGLQDTINLAPYRLELVTACTTGSSQRVVRAIHVSAVATKSLTYCNESNSASEVLRY